MFRSLSHVRSEARKGTTSLLGSASSSMHILHQGLRNHHVSRMARNGRMETKRNFGASTVYRSTSKAPDPRLVKQMLPTSTRHHPLDKIFKPKSVALIGASEKEGSVGRSIFWNLISSPFGGVVYPVNARRDAIMGIKAYRSVFEIPREEPVDLAVICIPAPAVVDALRECAEAGIKGVVIISAGFLEAGDEGKAWAKEIGIIGKEHGMRIIGPNCLGVLNPNIGFNATFATTGAKPGRLALISQSGAIATAMLDHALSENIGFSKFASIGSMVDVKFSDLIDYYGQDDETEAIVIYMESIGDARAFMASASSIALTKPIIVIKVGKTAQGAQAAVSHTGSMAGQDSVFQTAFRRSGVLRVDNVDDLFGITEILAKQPRPSGNRLAIVTNAGGPGIIATDSLIEHGGSLAQLSSTTIERLNAFLPEHWSHACPIDILGDAPPDRYAKTLQVVMEDVQADGVLVILTPQSMTHPTETADAIIEVSKHLKKPLFCCFMGGEDVSAGRRRLAQAGIPNFHFPDQATKYFSLLHKYTTNIDTLFQNNGIVQNYRALEEENVQRVRTILMEAQASERYTLSEHESKQILQLYGIDTSTSHIATSAEEAVQIADSIGYPVVLKLHSFTITHKQDVGGVKLNLRRREDVTEAFRAIESAVSPRDFMGCSVQAMENVRDGYELIIGASSDAQFGPTILFGTGGSFVEIYKDTTLGLPPISYDIAQRLIDSTSISKILSGYRGREPVNMEHLQRILVRFSRLVTDHWQWIREIDINPLLASSKRINALDARILLHPKGSKPTKPALRPYPREYTTRYEDLNVTIRHIRVRDFQHLIPFFTRVSEFMKALQVDERALHYIKTFEALKELDMNDLEGKERQLYNSLRRLCIGNIEKEMVMIAETEAGRIIAVTRFSRLADPSVAELTVVIDPQFQRKGLGTFMLNHLLSIAKREGVSKMRSTVSEFNEGFVRQSVVLGFREISRLDGEITFEIDL